MQLFIKDAKKSNVTSEVLEVIEGKEPETIKSVLLSLRGNDVTGFLKTWEGTIQWIAKSPYRPAHKRKNWYVGINATTPPEEEMFSRRDFKFDTMKAAGPGGQHVNKSQTAVRVTHVPSRLVAIAQEERSQYLNKKLALARLLTLIEAKHQDSEKRVQQEQWEMHNELERGNPVRVFQGPRFKEN